MSSLAMWRQFGWPLQSGSHLSFKIYLLIGSVVKNLPANAGDRFDLWVRKIIWRRKWQPILVFLPGKSHGQRSLAGYSHGVVKNGI